MKEPRLTPEEFARSRALSDAELLRQGANFTPGEHGPRLEVTPEQLEQAKALDQSTKNPEVASEIDQHYTWIRSHMWQFLSWIKNNYGSLAEFQKEVGLEPIRNEKPATEVDLLYEAMHNQMFKYLSWVKANYASLEAFEKEISVKPEPAEADESKQERAA